MAGTSSIEKHAAAWIEVQAPLERQLAPLGERAIAALAPASGEHILDIGCGAGPTVLDLARAVTPGGSVLGVDISAPLLEVARGRAAGVERVDFLQADAQAAPFPAAGFDAAFSRFGVMFFADPVAAFGNIRRALKPAGRLAFVCWRALEANDLDIVPLRAAEPWLPPQPPPDPGAPDPFSFADQARIRAVLEGAGFQAIEIEAHDQPVIAGDLETTLALALRVGALGKILREAPHLRDPCIAPVREALAKHLTSQGVALNAATWIVTARAP